MSVRLTQYSHGAGCGCKIAPATLREILAGSTAAPDQTLLVGNDVSDDCAAVDIGDGRAVLSTTDFFMPIVDDPFTFGQIAATNALSDIYAMGGSPLVAVAILGWPTSELPPSVAAEVLRGGRAACAFAACPLGGGHSIDSPEPIFGLAVTGTVAIEQMRRNQGARPQDALFLTKPLGVGILSTAQKQGIVDPADHARAVESMIRLNSIGRDLAEIDGVRAMTDVTGFGLVGHLLEMCAASGVGARVATNAIPMLADLPHYVNRGAVPGGTRRNLASYGERVACEDELWRTILADPQTSGGLLVSVAPRAHDEVISTLRENGLDAHAAPIGWIVDAEVGVQVEH